MNAGALREKLVAELGRVKRELGADAREARRQALAEAYQRSDFAFDRGDHNIVAAERAYLAKGNDAWIAMQTAIDAWFAVPGADATASARTLALRLRRAGRVGPGSFVEDPKAAWIRIDAPKDETEPVDDAIRRLVTMYRRWAAGRGFPMLALADGDPVGGALLRVEGRGVYGALKTESGEHRFTGVAADGRPTARRVEVEVFADARRGSGLLSNNMSRSAVVTRHDRLVHIRQDWDGGASLWAHLPESDTMWTIICDFLNAGRMERMMELMVRGLTRNFHDPMPMADVREYALAPSPRVRDVWSGIETADADGVLSGAIDRFLDGPEGGDPF